MSKGMGNINKLIKYEGNTNCLIVGDIMLDRYLSGEVSRISPEAPIPIVHVKNEKYVLGGAANVASNMNGFHVNTILCGIIGSDYNGDMTLRLLQEKGIIFEGITSSECMTTTKTRVTGMNQQIVRLDYEDDSNITVNQEQQLLIKIKSAMERVQVIVISDYKKGVCTDTICREVISLAKSKGKLVIVDPKIKDWSKYAGADLITPNFKEFMEALSVDISNTEEVIKKYAIDLIHKYQLKGLLVTRSQYGMTYLNGLGKCQTFNTVAQEVFDVSGAGDTVIATIAACLTRGETIEQAIEISNIAAGISVSKAGTYTVTIEEVLAFLNSKNTDFDNKIVSVDTMVSLIHLWKKENNKIVFTNGCFDILHKGHITYLDKAKKLGDKLIVGLNSDRSVKILKGDKRPINKEEDRALVLAALSCIDLIVLFDEETPYELIKCVEPDVLVKGGDYKSNEVVGREFAKELKLIPFVDGYSTTKIIDGISNEN